MNNLNSLRLSYRFAVLIAVFILGLAVYGGWSFKTLNDLKVNGPLYQRIVQGKDLVADILPPPEYILESYLVTLQLAGEADRTEQDKLIEKLKSLKADYDTRHVFWGKQGLEDGLNDIFLKQAHEPASAFYGVAFDELVPAVQNGDQDAIHAVMARIKPLYETHRKAIDQVVQITNKRNATDEAAARDRIRSSTVLLLGILAISIIASIAVAAAIIRGLMASLGGELEYAVKIARTIADGNLTVPVETRAGDNSSLLAAMKTMQANLFAIIGNVNQSVEKLAQSAAQLSVSASRVADAVDQQHEETQSMAGAIEEISGSINQITDNAKDAEQNTLASGEMSSHGLDMVNNATQEMSRIADAVNSSSGNIKELGDKSERISGVVNVIKDIADQTNLLALNAAIEAARAGEQGRGFAVVADEVRKLAERTSSSTKEIAEMIADIENGTRGAVSAMEEADARMSEGVKMVDSVKQAIEKINESADIVIGEVRGITEAMREQGAAHNQVAENVSIIAEKIEQTSSAINAIAQAANELETLSATLKASVNQFKVA